MKMIKNAGTPFILAMSIAIAFFYISCTKEKLVNNGEPRIRYVRITDPVSADSLLIGANQGNLIAIMGENLQDAVQIWFNDQKASLTPTYITNTTILVSVPSPIPIEISNILKIVFANGSILNYTFEVQISKPLISSMNCEYVLTGSTATIRGDFFYEPMAVTFSGGVEGELVSVTDKMIQVIVPNGAEAGPITIKTNFGESKSDFWFRDNRNIFISSDPYEGWWNSSYVVSNPGPDDPPKINGNYIHVKKSIGGWGWSEIAGGPADAMPIQSKNIPDAALLKPEDYNFKFEVNTLLPYNANMIKMNVGVSNEENNGYLWNPPFDTKGLWQTVVIPFEEIVGSYSKKPPLNPKGYYTRIWFHGPGDLNADLAFDNFRIVPKYLK